MCSNTWVWFSVRGFLCVGIFLLLARDLGHPPTDTFRTPLECMTFENLFGCTVAKIKRLGVPTILSAKFLQA